MRREVYKVRQEGYYNFVRNMDNEYIDADELESLGKELQTMAGLMRELNITQYEIARNSLLRFANELLSESPLFYPPPDHVAYRPNQNRKRGLRAFCGVYMISHSSKPGLIKIGYSYNIYQRTKTFYKQFKAEPVEVVAVLSTAQPESLEKAFHIAFEKHRIEGEWFRAEPVVEWLDYCIAKAEAK